MKSDSRTFFLLFTMAFGTAIISSCDKMEVPQESRIENSSDTMRQSVLRKAAKANGVVPARDLEIATEPGKVEVGRLIFESPLMSINGSISCRDCHLNEFGSADGLPNAVGVGGQGQGVERVGSGGQILPRNTLPFWGRGGIGFNTFFWDGKVSKVDAKVVSQFGDLAPSDDPLIVAVHLPSVELREMVADTPEVRSTSVSEEVPAAKQIQTELTQRFSSDPKIGAMLRRVYNMDADQLSFVEVADSLANFIRHEFRIRPTAFEKFVFEDGTISDQQLAGGVLFYGRGRCASCHSGPYFSDQDFHAVAFPQLGFGKNGFGVDQGRYNVTLNPDDRFLFRTPPLHNVRKTAPYSHSGSVATLQEAIISHYDPLRFIDPAQMTLQERNDLYLRLAPASREDLSSPLSDKEVEQLVAFLGMLEFGLEDH